jgi:tryptophan synthase beta chain
MVREFQRVIGHEALAQCRMQCKRLPDTLVACVGGGSNAIGLFTEFLPFRNVEIIGVEAGGCGLKTGQHSASLSAGRVGVLHGSMGYLLQDEQGQVRVPHSISAGLDYPGVGPEHSFLRDSGRARYVAVTDNEALDAFELLSREEGILPALESAHAIAALHRLPRDPHGKRMIVVCLSGRGDKDLATVMRHRREK